MDLLTEKNRSLFNTEIKKGTLIWAKSEKWDVGVPGFISGVSEEQLTVMFHPNISNVVNHYIIPAKEVADGKWIIRWSEDLETVNVLDGGEIDETGGTDQEEADGESGIDSPAD